MELMIASIFAKSFSSTFRSLTLHPRYHSEKRVQRAHAPYLLQLLPEVVKGERITEDPLLKGLGFLLVERLLGLLDEREDIAHAEYAGGYAVRMERLEHVDFFTYADELDRPLGDLPYEAPPILVVTVHLCEDDAVDRSAHGLPAMFMRPDPSWHRQQNVSFVKVVLTLFSSAMSDYRRGVCLLYRRS
jgi:hypothetical protein